MADGPKQKRQDTPSKTARQPESTAATSIPTRSLPHGELLEADIDYLRQLGDLLAGTVNLAWKYTEFEPEQIKAHAEAVSRLFLRFAVAARDFKTVLHYPTHLTEAPFEKVIREHEQPVSTTAPSVKSPPADPVALPGTAPELYRDRPNDPTTGKRETIRQFLTRVWWNPWISAGMLTRADFRRLDPGGEMALRNALRRANHGLPPELHLPTRNEQVSRDLEQRTPDELRDAQRLLKARYRRMITFNRDRF